MLGLAGSLSLLAGWRLYLCVLATGIAMHFGVPPLPDHLQSPQILANPWVMGAAEVATLAEFFADKVAWIDSAWHSVHTFIRPVGGALLTLAIVDSADPATQVIAFLLGGGATLLSHGSKAGSRAVVKVQTPVLILSGISEMDTKVRSFGFGADDYVTKPFRRKELVARIHAVVRCSKGHSQSVIKTGKEYAMLELLLLRKGTTLTKEMFLNHLYGGMDEPELKIIDVFICKLRKKLSHAWGGANHIETVWGRGYVLRDPDEKAEAA
ncbi:MAG: DUF4126 family protein [Alphaproteobacteria bacterium]|nr:DUF4126 family protein [Alphaproteobacteria bacterium]